ncbi:MAG: cell division protein FtsZ [Deltaproteobacteria bacterium]|nr:cell division protein FtsZ [Deltaproteobacteria bacterium]
MEPASPPGARLIVVGVGGAGGNAVNNMIAGGLAGVGYVVANTDVQALNRSAAATKLQIGAEVTRGLGAGARPEVGARAAEEDEVAIREAIGDADMVFVTAGMGGGTGTGAAPVVARIAREAGALTIGVVTRPFRFEGRQRSRRAESGLAALAEQVDTLIVIPNDRLLEIAGAETTLEDGFRLADSVLLDAVRSMTDIIQTPGLVNVDYADVVTVMQQSGLALMGTGISEGEGRAREAAHAAISSPLLEGVDLSRATGLLVNLTGGSGMTLREVDEAMSLIQDAIHEDAETIFGAVIDPAMGAAMRITVVATGFGDPARDEKEDSGRKGSGRSDPGLFDRPTIRTDRNPSAAPKEPAAPPPPLPLFADDHGDLEMEEAVTVVLAGRRAAVAEASVAMPIAAPAPAVDFARVVQEPIAQAAPVADSLGAPTFVRNGSSKPAVKRQPLMRNPFSDDRALGDLDAPAFLRK